MKTLITATLTAALLSAGPVLANGWTLNNDTSRLAFASIKKDVIGEVHSFNNLSGGVAADGSTEITIDLTSLETNIDIRNERMAEHVFKNAPSAKITAQMDMETVNGLAVGESEVVDAEATLDLLGVEVEFFTELFVLRAAEDRVVVTSNDMIMLNTVDAEIDPGIDMLMQLAELPGITRVAPVTLRFVFEQS